jgi:hypothetical protein
MFIFASTLRITGNAEERPANVKGGTMQKAERGKPRSAFFFTRQLKQFAFSYGR